MTDKQQILESLVCTLGNAVCCLDNLPEGWERPIRADMESLVSAPDPSERIKPTPLTERIDDMIAGMLEDEQTNPYPMWKREIALLQECKALAEAATPAMLWMGRNVDQYGVTTMHESLWQALCGTPEPE